MYLMKVKKNIEDQDLQDMQEKRERHLERSSTRDSGESPRAGSRPSSVADDRFLQHDGPSPSSSSGAQLHPDELPDGSCFSPQRVIPNVDTETTSTKEAQFIGAFSVCGEDQNSRAEFVQKELTKLRHAEKSIPVLLVISITGIKVYNTDGQSIRMAHALKRISYATCDPEFCQFSFLAREPCGQSNLQYCHAFLTNTPQQAEELNTIVGNAFKMAYAEQLQRSQQPTFLELIAQQVEQQKAKFQEIEDQAQQELQKRLTQISQATVQQRVEERRQRRQQENERLERERERARLAGKDRTAWAKQFAGRAKHRSYIEASSSSGRESSLSPPRQSYTPSPPPTHATVMALREVLDAQEPRLHGSPVTAMKDTIDNHFNNANRRLSDQMRSDTDYLLPVQHSQVEAQVHASQTSSLRHSRLANRPLPSTPNEERSIKRTNGHSSPSTRERNKVRSSPPESASPSSSAASRDSPESVDRRYQNDSPVHNRSNSSHSDGTDSGVDSMYQGPPLPIRYDSLKKIDPTFQLEGDENLCQSSWYQAGIPREIALEILGQEDIGSFIVRDSTTHPNCYALSVKVPKFDNPTGISHYLIMRTNKGVKLKGLDKEWPSLSALVTHHTVMREMLPCTLNLPRNSNNPAFRDVDKDEKDEDEDYQKLSDFSSMMADLKMK